MLLIWSRELLDPGYQSILRPGGHGLLAQIYSFTGVVEVLDQLIEVGGDLDISFEQFNRAWYSQVLLLQLCLDWES